MMKKICKNICLCLTASSLIMMNTGQFTVFAEEKEVEYYGVAASSTLYADGYDYSAGNIFDRDFSTAWVEGASGDGIGESISISIPEGIVLTRGVIYPGYLKSEDLFGKNAAPNYISISTGGKEVELKAGKVDSFNSARSGYQFKLGEGLVSDGTVTITVKGVRSGTKYTDTCITELMLYANDELITEEVVVDDVDTDAAGAGWPEEDEILGMMRLAEILYEDYIGYGTPQEIEVTSDDLEEEHKAMGLFWYQYHTNDERISNEGEYNAAKLNDLRHIYYELYGDLMDEGILVFLSEYCEQRDGDTIYMSGTGDFGAVGEFYFDEPNDVVGEDGVLTITGPVMVYSGEDYIPDCLYEVVFTEHENMPGQYVFESVKVS